MGPELQGNERLSSLLTPVNGSRQLDYLPLHAKGRRKSTSVAPTPSQQLIAAAHGEVSASAMPAAAAVESAAVESAVAAA
jgi:hypothetical protein